MALYNRFWPMWRISMKLREFRTITEHDFPGIRRDCHWGRACGRDLAARTIKGGLRTAIVESELVGGECS
jgi:hypothetical protein